MPADTAKSVAVGTDNEIRVGGSEDLRQTEMSGSLCRRVFTPLFPSKETHVPGQLQQIPVERAGQGLAVGSLFDGPVKVDQQIGTQVRQVTIVVDNGLLDTWIAEGEVCGVQLGSG